MLNCNRQSLLALLLTTTLVAVQTALPWMHVGCQHDHSAARASAATAGHHHCRGHHHAHAPAARPEADPAPAVDQGHKHRLTEDCAACRYLLLSSVACEPAAICLIEQISLLPSPLPVVAAASEPVGLYRSRAPPALS
jgi:hypothetical protein